MTLISRVIGGKRTAIFETAVATALAFALFAGPASAQDSDAKTLQDQIAQLQAQLAQQAEQLARLQAQVTAAANPVDRVPARTTPVAMADNAMPQMSATQVGGYGEVNYNNYVNDGSRTQADMRRFVISVSHQFNDRITFNGELELEHAIAASGDDGEAAVEQAWLNYRFDDNLNVKAGLFLMPFGFLNPSHEPTNYYGVERNEIETRIIPSTWREGGIGVYGDTAMGLAWDVGVVTGFDSAKFEEPESPLAGVHQELQFAKADDLSVYGALNYHGVPGLTVGGAVFHGNSLHDNADFKADNTLPDFSGISAPITLWDIHARWQANGLDLQAVYARGKFGDADQLDAVIDAYNTANSADLPFVPEEFYGWYGQAAYTVWDNGQMSLTPFVRYEQFDTQDKMPAGFAADPENADKVTTAGFSFKPDPSVVVKLDYQDFGDHDENDRVNVGVGYAF